MVDHGFTVAFQVSSLVLTSLCTTRRPLKQPTKGNTSTAKEHTSKTKQQAGKKSKKRQTYLHRKKCYTTLKAQGL